MPRSRLTKFVLYLLIIYSRLCSFLCRCFLPTIGYTSTVRSSVSGYIPSQSMGIVMGKSSSCAGHNGWPNGLKLIHKKLLCTNSLIWEH